MTYKVGDKVLFTFLGQRKEGEIVDKNGKEYKVESTDGMRYPGILKEKPDPDAKKKGRRKKEVVLGYIIEKL